MIYQLIRKKLFCYLFVSKLGVLFFYFSFVCFASTDLSIKSRVNVINATHFSLEVSAKTIDFGVYPKNVIESITQSLIVLTSVNTGRVWHISVCSSCYSSGSTQVSDLPQLWFEKVTNLGNIVIPQGTIVPDYAGDVNGPYNGVGLKSNGQTVTFYNSANPENGENIGLKMWVNSGLTVNHFKGANPLPLGVYSNTIVFTLYE